MNRKPSFNIALLHDRMVNKEGKLVTTSLTLIDVHDIARSSRTFGVESLFICHPSPALRKLTRRLQQHWDEGFGATYNPNRKEALEVSQVVSSLDEAIAQLDERHGELPLLVATSAKEGGARISFEEGRKIFSSSQRPVLMMLGTGWGMGDELLARADYFLEPVRGPGEYNHLSVRSACAIMLDRLFGH